MARSLLSRVRRNLYLTQRGLGDYQAAQRGPEVLAKRLVRRKLVAAVFRRLPR